MTGPLNRKPIEDPEEDLHRQVHPTLVDDDQPSWQAFCPMPKDKGLLSVSAGSLATPETSWCSFVARGNQSYGVLSITAKDCTDRSLTPFFDPLDENDDGGPDEAHAVIDFNGLPSKSQQNKHGKALLEVSLKRGWTFRATDAGGPAP